MSNVRPESMERITTETLVTEIRTVLQNARNNAAPSMNRRSPIAPITENGRSKSSPAR